MKLGTQNPQHRRCALLQLALGAISLITVIPLSLTSGIDLLPTLPSSSDMQAHADLTWLAAWVIGLSLLVFQCVAAWRYLRLPATSRVAFILATLLTLMAFPIGTAIGLYSLWVVVMVPIRPERDEQSSEHEVA